MITEHDFVDNINTDIVVENVRAKLLNRSKIGINKYNTTLHENNKDNYLIHAQEEAMDLCNYIEKLLIQERDIKQLIKKHRNDSELGYILRKIYGNH